MKKRKRGKGLLWIIVICIFALLGFYFRGQITSKLGKYATRARSVFAAKSDKRASETARPKSQTVGSIKGSFTFFPDGRNPYAWSVTYPDGRVFKLGEEFSSDCSPTLGLAKAPATVRFEFNEQRSCRPGSRKPIQVDAGLLKNVSGDGSPELIAAVLTGGNVYGHASSLISLTPRGPKVVRHLD